MVLHLQEQNKQPQNPIWNLDSLLCEEDGLDEEDLGGGYNSDERNLNQIIKIPPLLECDMFWEDDEVKTLLSKEKENLFDCTSLVSDEFLLGVRKESLEWMLTVIDYYDFNALTAVLAVNYFDRFISGVCFEKDNPWMSPVVAVACLSIAAKVEEIQVPLLLDLQVAKSQYKFKAKTIKRIELLVLSTLKWKMNPVTPLSFIDHIIRRFGLMANLHIEFQMKCENLILGIITDSRLLHYPPSIIATATMCYVINEIKPCNAVDYLDQLMGVLKVTKDSIDKCYDLILELMGIPGSKICQTHKRKCQSMLCTPDGVIDAYFSCENSDDSLVVTSPVSSFPEPQYKRSRTIGSTNYIGSTK
ncbi:cyclin-D3-3-like [Solanum dulcamara]|uniref:cyclin-D3-3-like n=1 Tax=Solanum dulcamara TaxID=45834 RepID=UPI00248558C3|nr:cyclin-D3-3-like [Solanum dulcamara]